MDERMGLFAGRKDALQSMGMFMLGAAMPVLDRLLFGHITDATVSGVFLAAASLATIWQPGAGISKTEGWQNFVLSHFTLGLFGNFGGCLLQAIVLAGESDASVPITPLTGVHGLVVSTSVYVAFWTTGVQSRAYFFELFEKLGFAERLPTAAAIVGTLCGPRVRRHDVAHRLIGAILDDGVEELLEGDFWREMEGMVLKGARNGHEARLTRRLATLRAELQDYLREESGGLVALTERPERGRREA